MRDAKSLMQLRCKKSEGRRPAQHLVGTTWACSPEEGLPPTLMYVPLPIDRRGAARSGSGLYVDPRKSCAGGDASAAAAKGAAPMAEKLDPR